MRDLTKANLDSVMSAFYHMPITLQTIRLMDARLEDNFGRQYRALVDGFGHVWIVNIDSREIIARPDV